MERLQGGTGMKKEISRRVIDRSNGCIGTGRLRQQAGGSTCRKQGCRRKRQKPCRKRQKKLRLQKGKKS